MHEGSVKFWLFRSEHLVYVPRMNMDAGMDPRITAGLIAAAGVLLGIIITGLGQVIGFFVKQRHEDRKHWRGVRQELYPELIAYAERLYDLTTRYGYTYGPDSDREEHGKIKDALADEYERGLVLLSRTKAFASSESRPVTMLDEIINWSHWTRRAIRDGAEPVEQVGQGRVWIERFVDEIRKDLKVT